MSSMAMANAARLLARRNLSLGAVLLQSQGKDGSFDAENRRRMMNRILYRSKQRGFLELDLVLGKWTENNIRHLDDSQIDALVQVLDMENPELWRYLSGQAQAPESLSANPVFTAIHRQIADNLQAHSSSKTRAEPGQPWVRGWDDFKKTGPNNSIGNQ